jgi:hypothetical protein
MGRMADNGTETGIGTGLEITPGADMTRIQVACEHQQGLIYVVPAERSWVCNSETLPAHALAGFFRELVGLQRAEVSELMRQWGIYYRQLPRSEASTDQEPTT